MKKSQEQALRRKTGDLNSHCGWKDYTFNDGPARGVRAFDLYNGRGTELTVLADRGLDIPFLKFKGHQLAFASKTGIKSPALYQEEGVRGFLRQFYGGLLTTCGISYAGAPCEDGGQALGLHGPVSNTPAGRVGAEIEYQGDEAVILLRGEIRESQVFGENLVIKRALRLHTEKDALVIEDTVENQGFVRSPLMLVYHINFGYPMLDEGARVYSSAKQVTPRDEIAEKDLGRYHLMEEPGDERPEECFFHTGQPEDAFAMLHNEKLGIAAVIRFDGNAFPLLCEWKCLRAGDYALGLEPTVSGVLNRNIARENGMLRMLEPGESRAFTLRLEFLDDPAAIRQFISRSREKDFSR
jgi:hypothetical protein